ncbi:MAG: 30S ribosomal protein S8 [Myxococcales bacterium]|nr:30S ribosomal protein S8 [Myxococcales bacterium]
MAGVINDPIADMLTRIRNGINARHVKVPMPHSKLKERVAEVLKREGFIESFEIGTVTERPLLTIQLRYDRNRDPVITGLKRVSRPGLRQYVNVESIPTIRNGLGVAILSTSRGVMTDREARRERVGGELMCTVW